MTKHLCILGLGTLLSIPLWAQVPKSGLIAFFPFTDTSSFDIGKNEYVCAKSAGVSGTADRNMRSNSALVFDGQSTVAINTKTQFLLRPSTISISLWFKPSATQGEVYPMLFKHANATNTMNCFSLNLDLAYPDPARHTLDYALSVSSAQLQLNQYLRAPIEVVKFGDWNHVVCTYDGISLRMFVNGTLASNTAVPGIIYYPANLLNDMLVGLDYTGAIDDLAFYNYAVDAGTVTQLYTDTTSELETGTGTGSGENAQQFSIYPNPAREVIYLSSNAPIKQLSILNVTGQLVLETSATDAPLQVGNLSPGVYFVRLTGDKGQQTVQKLTIE